MTTAAFSKLGVILKPGEGSHYEQGWHHKIFRNDPPSEMCKQVPGLTRIQLTVQIEVSETRIGQMRPEGTFLMKLLLGRPSWYPGHENLILVTINLSGKKVSLS